MKIVIFDMDGTLIDTKKDITTSINYVRKTHHGLPPVDEQFVVDAINMPVRNLPELFYSTPVYLQSDRDLFEEHYFEECIRSPYLYDGIAETLQALKSSQININVATNAPTIFAKRMLKHLQVSDMFDTIIGADEAGASKPDPKMLEIILSNYGSKHRPQTTWMVGDNSKDVEAAKSISISSIFATWGFSSHGEGDYVASHPLKVLEIVK
ncbi:HAD family hydrolase [Sulfurimonas sp. HSL-1716]|uniref:HAD family hydrolase n=1 Tax=Hydrocurvibacter sulfurireducens TaxID=3131937 RepID=UPI0031F9528B